MTTGFPRARTVGRFLLRAAGVLVLSQGAVLLPCAFAADWRERVDAGVVAALDGDQPVEVLVILRSQADLGDAARPSTARERRSWVVRRLRAAAADQAEIVAELRRRGVPHRAYWIVNMVWVRASATTVRWLAEREEVDRISANPRVRQPPSLDQGTVSSRAGIEPGVAHVGAPDLWALGVTGQGVVVAGQDTGYDWLHPALKAAYRGWNGGVANHDYNWHDAIHSGGGVCGPDSPEPCDDSSHGTHTMGTIVGDDGLGHQIGVAPGARWIGCRNMDRGVGTPASYAECFQFFLAPTNLAGGDPDPGRAPDVINNSWSCPPSEGCTDPLVLQGPVEAARAAGILVVASAGNSGPVCATVTSPPALYEAATSVGATDASDEVAWFSSRGPVTVDGSNRIKPDLVAPGVDILSSVPGGGYGVKSGTSMAGPHVAGVAALTLAAAPCLRGDAEALESALLQAANPRTSSESCGGVAGEDVPNCTYGFGAVRAAVAGSSACGPEWVFGDDFETGGTWRWSATEPAAR